jgi:hypothetical protein
MLKIKEEEMKPFDHAQLSVKKYGGMESDYQKVHDFFDQIEFIDILDL